MDKEDLAELYKYRKSLIEKCLDKGFDGSKLHLFMVKHDLFQPFTLFSFDSDEQKQRQIDAYDIKQKKNLIWAHIEIDRTPHYE